jgi:sulfoxide reductase heme-binding subunit YedZ
MSLTVKQIKFLKLFFRLLLVVPWLYWFYASFQGLLGAEPIVKLNTQSGYITLWFLLLNLLLGALLAFKKKWPDFMRWIFTERRALGIATGLYAIIHLFTYFGKEAFEAKALDQILTKNYLTFAIFAFLIMMILLLTSNDLSVRKLGIKKWKNLHRLVYLGLFLVMGHVFLIEKGNIPVLALSIFPIALLELVRGVRHLTHKIQGRNQSRN